MSILNGDAPSAIGGDTLDYPSSGALLQLIMPYLMSVPGYTDLPPYWSPRRDWVLAGSVDKESMWGAAVARTATKFAAHGYTLTDSQNSQRKVASSQELLKRADGGEGWVMFAMKVIQDLLTTDNGVFIRIRRQGDETRKIRVKAQTVAGGEPGTFDEAAVTLSKPGAKIIGLYHMDSLRCTRTGNLAYPVRYMAVDGSWQILRWDQVLTYSDQTSPRAELFNVGKCAGSRAYKTVAKLSAMEQLVYENLTGGGANKLAFIQGITDQTLKDIITSGQNEQRAKGLVYYLGTILGAIPSDTPISTAEIRLKELLTSFVPKDERDNAYLIYANCIGVPVQDIQPLSGQGLGTGTQSTVLQDAAQGIGIAAFLKWWEQTVSDRVLPATTELHFIDENDMRDQKQRAEVQKMRADTRKVQIDSGEITPAIARQLAVDSEDLPRELVPDDATAGGQLSDDEKPESERAPENPAALTLIRQEPTAAPAKPQQPGVTTKASGHTGVMVALYPDAQAAKKLAATKGVTEPIDDLHLTLVFLGDSDETPLANNKEALIGAVQKWALQKGKPLGGVINGVGRFFNEESDSTNAVYVSPDVPGLPELRQSLCEALHAAGFDYAENHGFTPHLTVAYVPLEAPTPDFRVDIPVAFSQVTLAWGDEHTDFPLGMQTATKSRFWHYPHGTLEAWSAPVFQEDPEQHRAGTSFKTYLASLKDASDDDARALLENEMGWARRISREARKQHA